MTPKQQQAIAIRDAAYRRFRQDTPAQKLGPCIMRTVLEGPVKIMHTLDADKAVMPLPHGIDIWIDGEKVFNFRWDDDGTFKLHSFKRGPWEESILNAAPPQ